jgi:hypothetical protein
MTLRSIEKSTEPSTALKITATSPGSVTDTVAVRCKQAGPVHFRPDDATSGIRDEREQG